MAMSQNHSYKMSNTYQRPGVAEDVHDTKAKTTRGYVGCGQYDMTYLG